MNLLDHRDSFPMVFFFKNSSPHSSFGVMIFLNHSILVNNFEIYK